MLSSRFILGLSLAFAVAAVAGFNLVQLDSARANHPQGHAIASQRSVLAGEEYCIGINSTAVTHQLSQILNAFMGALGSNWDYTSPIKVQFGPYSTDCNLMVFTLPYIEVRAWVKPEWNSLCGGAYNGVFKWGTSFRSGSTYFYEGANIYMRDEHSTNYHVINHEMGHVLGLDDPGACAGYVSVMHDSFYCGLTNYSYPTDSDAATVADISDQ